ncbi:unnamed protein product [Closterium sp. Naga37s-1]|nr:unnamed protein product [Closterium sp. Naga37s-1]
MFGTRNDRGDMTSNPAPAEERGPVGMAEPASAAKLAGAEAEAAAAAAAAGAAAAAATDQSPYSSRAGRTKVVEAQEGQHTATVVWLDGLGDSGNGISNWLNMVWESVGEQGGNHLLDLPHVKWIFPSAPTASVSVNRGHRSPSWYDIHGFNPDAPVDAAGLDEAARYIAGILEEERRAHPGGWGLPRGLDANGLDEAARYIAGILEDERRANPGGWGAVLCCAVLIG